MKIKRLEINNFRQYYGKIVIDFSTDNNRNTTIIQGKNGEGKSNLMNSITWCLYGDELFKSETNIGRSIANTTAVIKGNYQGADVSVKMYLEDGEKEYIAERKQHFEQKSGGIVSRTPTFTVHEKDVRGTVLVNQPDWFVEKRFIPKDLRGFFFFDGERISSYFVETTANIKPNVEKIAQIDTIKGAINTLGKIKSSLWKDMKKYDTSGDELPIDPDEQNEIIYTNGEEIKRIDSKIADFNSKIEEIDRYLSKNSNETLKALTNEREKLEKRKTQLKKEIEQTNKSLSELIIDRLPIILAYAALTKTVEIIDENTAKGLLPPKIQDTFVRDLLEEGVCICGRPLDENSECRTKLMKLVENVFSKNTAEDSREGRYTIKTLLKKVNFVPEYTELFNSVTEKQSEFDQIVDELNGISSQISAFDETEIRNKEAERKAHIESVNQLNRRKGGLEAEIEGAREILAMCEDEISKLKVSEGKYSKLKAQRDYVCQLESVLTKIRDSIVEDVRLQLETKTRSYFYDMIWKTGTFENVRLIDEGARYRFSVTQDGQECLGDLSSGEKQILALAFSAALHSVSGYSVPVFIDTPLGRISEDARENVAASLPKYLSETQLIILPTDTEYTPEIRSKMSQFVGAEYKIRYDESKKMSEVNNYD